MKPFFKWSGGKSRELKKVDKFLPDNFDSYYEPFLGGGAVWLHLNPKKSILGDTYPELINFFTVLKDQPTAIIGMINQVSYEYNERVSKCTTKESQQKVADEFFYPYRDNQFDEPLDRALAFFIVRQLCFSGMLRFSNAGKFNVPYGWYKTLKSIDIKHKALLEKMTTATFLCSSWEETLSTASNNDFVFLDPPYTREFQKYHPNGEFGSIEHTKLAKWFGERHAKAMIIINKDDLTYGLYKDFIKEEYSKKYSIQFRDRMTEKDSNAVHFLATNY